MTLTLRRLGAVALIVTSAAVFSACSASPAPAPSGTGSAAPAPSSPAPTATPTSTAAADPTCETIIPQTTVKALKDVGWSAKSEPFRIGETVFDDGIQCTWGNYSVASDRVQIYGWAPISSDAAATAQQQLVQTGWTREEAPEGTYITEKDSTAMATDAQGYGLTYLFGDGWVKYADTKQGLVLIEWPKP